MSWRRWLLVGIAVALVAGVGGPFVYIHFVEGPAPSKLTLSSASPGTSGKAGTEGRWKVASGSKVGYRIHETLFGQSNTAVGRTSHVSGSVDVQGTNITSGTFTVDMTTVTSDKPTRDRQFHGRIMETSKYRTATFQLTQPIVFPSLPAQGTTVTKSATGNLTMHGVTKAVTFQLKCQRSDGSAQVNGSIPITFADYSIGNPSFGPVTTEDHGLLEFTLHLEHV